MLVAEEQSMAEIDPGRVQSYVGGCHCGAVRYRVQLELSRSAAPHSVWERLAGAHAFELLAGEEHMSGHQFEAEPAHHFYCERCGARVFTHHTSPRSVGFYTIDLRSLHAREEREQPMVQSYARAR